MRLKLQNIEDKRDEMQRAVDAERRNGQEIKSEVIVMQIGQTMLMIERVHQEDASSLETILSPGITKNKTQFLFQLLRQSTLQLAAVAHSCSEWITCLRATT